RGQRVIELEGPPPRPVPGEADRDERQARHDADEQREPDDRCGVDVFGRSHGHPPRIPRRSISTPSTARTPRKTRRTVRFVRRTRTRVPTNAPTVIPRMTGAAR